MPFFLKVSLIQKKMRKLYLYEKYNFKIIEELNNQEFGKCIPNIVLAAINDKKLIYSHKTLKQINTGIDHLIIQRGKITMHKIKICRKSAISLVHSTNLRNNKIVNLEYRVKNSISRIDGPALLIHRVGHQNINKICIISSKEVYALSDCVIGIKVDTMSKCKQLKKIITDNWNDFANLYKGTGARYITVERLKYFLNIHEKSV